MSRNAFLALCLAFISTLAIAGPTASEGKLSIFRWNQGYRAEREPVFVGKMAESEFRAMVESGKLPEKDEIFAGCYLAHFEAEKKSSRAPASSTAIKPKSEVFRICK